MNIMSMVARCARGQRSMNTVAASQSRRRPAVDTTYVLECRHEAHPQRVVVDDSLLTPNLKLWTGRGHTLVLEFKGG